MTARRRAKTAPSPDSPAIYAEVVAATGIDFDAVKQEIPRLIEEINELATTAFGKEPHSHE